MIALLSKKVIAAAFLLVISTQIYAQVDISHVKVPITTLRQHVFALADDSLQGRETGMKGQLKAAYYCIKQLRYHHLFAAFRLDSTRASFRQTFPFTVTEVSVFGGPRVYGSPTYRKHELASLPLTHKDSNQVLYGDNIGGLLIGTDLKKEVVVVSAHYDHLGHSGKTVFHGADDNASGTASVLSVAAVFDSLVQQGIRPRRSILFVLFSGEEGGLLGSNYFVHNCPLPISQLVCDLNIDMVGRMDNFRHKQPDYCYLLTNKQESSFRKLVEKANKQSVNLAINQEGYDTKTDPDQHFYRSDHYNFAKGGIPAFFFTSGVHSDYHKPSDTADKIDYTALQKRATLVFQTAWLIANESIK